MIGHHFLRSKGLKKGTYKIAAKVSAKGNVNYESGNRVITVSVVVK